MKFPKNELWYSQTDTWWTFLKLWDRKFWGLKWWAEPPIKFASSKYTAESEIGLQFIFGWTSEFADWGKCAIWFEVPVLLLFQLCHVANQPTKLAIISQRRWFCQKCSYYKGDIKVKFFESISLWTFCPSTRKLI
jgi:hypothetical protein